MVHRRPRRSDQEWLELIQQCRSSGLTDKQWCEQHNIHWSIEVFFKVCKRTPYLMMQ